MKNHNIIQETSLNKDIKKHNDKNKKNRNINKIYLSNYKKDRANNNNDNFLVNKDMKCKNINKNKIIKGIAFYKLKKKKIHIKIKFEICQNFCPKKNKKQKQINSQDITMNIIKKKVKKKIKYKKIK